MVEVNAIAGVHCDRMGPRTVILGLSLLALLAPSRAGALMSLRRGDAPPPFVLKDLRGKTVGSDTLANAVSVVLFWSTWSPRSTDLLVDFRRHAATYGGRGLKIVAVNIDGESLGAEQKAAVRDFAAALDLPFPVLLDGGLKSFASWGVMAHPTEVLLDAGGRIAYLLPGYPETLREELEEQIRGALGIREAPPAAAAVSAGFAPQGMAQQHYNLGRQLLAKGEADKALQAFRRAAAADAAFLDPVVMVARVSLAAGDLAEAEQLVRQVAAEAVNRGDLRYLLGGLMLAKGDPDAAERAFRALRERLPREGWGAWGLGQVALARGDRAAALALFREARALQPDNVEGEAAVTRTFRDRWQRRETLPEEEGFVAVFPALGEMRERYRRLFGAPGSAP
jgi:tetratricopeptide (TPR) repeat protein